MAYSNEPCKFCGSLGPHIFTGKSSPGSDMPADETLQQRAPGPANGANRTPPSQPKGDQFGIAGSASTADPSLHLSHTPKEEMEIPVNIYPRSPMLEHIDEMDSYERKESKKRHGKNDDREYSDKFNDSYESKQESSRKKSFVEDEEERTQRSSARNIVIPIISTGLMLLLVIATIYVVNNFEAVTKWLAAPTVPEVFQPSEEPPSGIQPSQPPSQNLVSGSEKSLPVISEATIDSITEYGATVTWKTSEPCISKVLYKMDTGDVQNHDLGDRLTTYHKAVLTGLSSGKTYYLTLRSWNTAGIECEPVEKSFQTLVAAKDITPPQLLGQPSVAVTDSTATITWKTNEKSTSLVKYGPSTGYEFSTEENTENAVEHSMFIAALSPDTTYHFQVISADSSGNVYESPDFQFKTEIPSESSPYLGGRAPGFTLRTLDGNSEVSLSQYKGKKIVLNFWASWCSPCKVEMPHFQAFWDKYCNSNNVMLITIASSDSDLDELKSIISASGYNFIVCLDSSEDVFNRYGITNIPRTYFMDESGIIRRIQQGMFTGPGEIEFMLDSY